MNLSRTSGVQLHPTSLPSGRLGPDAYAWVDWLAAAGQTWWQMLPLGPPDEHDSPYKSASAFAASPKLLGSPSAPVSAAERIDFRDRASDWIEDWLAFAGEDALDDQVRFDREWTRAARPRERARREADRRHPDLRRTRLRRPARAPRDLQGRRRRRRPAGHLHRQGPALGQPLVRLAGAAPEGYAWWIARFKRVFELFDLARIDHFRGFTAYWAVPADAEFALSGSWKRGPGRAPFDAAREVLGELPLIAEDLGVITPPVTRLRESLGLPGMSVLQFGFTPGEEHTVHVPENNSVDQVVYTGTHDSDTIRGWYASITPAQRALVAAALARRGIEDPEIHWALIRLVFASPAVIAMIQVQDALGLGSEGRMNQPGSWARGAGDSMRCRPPTWRPGCARRAKRPGACLQG